MYYPFEMRVAPLTRVRRQRVLPLPGEVMVGRGERVEPIQVVARAELSEDFRILPVARLLGVPAARTSRYLRVKPGDQVQEGQVIASRRGLGARSVRSPIDGAVTAIGGGRVLIETRPAPVEVNAYLYGTVTSVVESYGVVVETMGALIQGVWGAGGESFGVLKCVVESADEPLEARRIDPSCHGTVLIGGSQVTEGALEQAQQFKVRGIVTGGLRPALVDRVGQLPFPVVVTEGMGEVPMSAPIFGLLTANDGREASISGRMRPCWGVVRPEIVIPLPAESVPGAQEQSGTPLAVGEQVRLVRAPYMGATGTVVALPPHARRIETGARVRGAEVDIGQEAPIFVPLMNLEVLR